MKKIMVAGISKQYYEDRYKIDPEHSKAEYGSEWGENIEGYIENALTDALCEGYAISPSVHEIELDRGFATGSKFYFIINPEGEPVAVCWLKEE